MGSVVSETWAGAGSALSCCPFPGNLLHHYSTFQAVLSLNGKTGRTQDSTLR